MLEKVAEANDKLIEKYLGGKELTVEEIKTGLRELTIKAAIYPIFVEQPFQTKGFKKFLMVWSIICRPLRISPI